MQLQTDNQGINLEKDRVRSLLYKIFNKDILRRFIYEIVSFIHSLYEVFFGKKAEIGTSPVRILIVKTHAIGDVMMISPAIRAIKKKYPQAELYVLVGEWSRQVLKNNPYITGVISFPDEILFQLQIVKIFSLVKQIRSYKFSWAFIFQPSIFIQSIIWLSGISFRIGFDEYTNGGALSVSVPWKKNDFRYIVRDFLQLPEIMGARSDDIGLDFPINEEDVAFAEEFIERNKGILQCRDGIIGLCPGGGINPRDKVIAKLWHIDRYAELIRIISEKYDVRYIIFGVNEDYAYIQRLIRNSKQHRDRIVNACDATTLHQMGAIFTKCRFVLTNDSAPLHVAVALSIPTVSIFGPTNHYCLLPDSGLHFALQSKTDCSPCYHNSPFPGCDWIRCMEDISVEDAVAAIEMQMR